MRIIFFAAMLSLISCTTVEEITKPNLQTQSSSLIPLAVGNEWHYVETKSGKKSVSMVKKSQTHKGSDWYLYLEFGEKFWVTNIESVQYESYGSFGKESLNISGLDGKAVLKAPNGIDKEYEVEETIVSYKECAQPIQVEAGTFECHIYKFDMGGGYYSINYYAKGVGLILNKFNSQNGYSESELVSYVLK